jgi:hypothetical protein
MNNYIAKRLLDLQGKNALHLTFSHIFILNYISQNQPTTPKGVCVYMEKRHKVKERTTRSAINSLASSNLIQKENKYPQYITMKDNEEILQAVNRLLVCRKEAFDFLTSQNAFMGIETRNLIENGKKENKEQNEVDKNG